MMNEDEIAYFTVR